MGQEWYEACARRFGGYQKLWDSRFEGAGGEAAFTQWLRATIRADFRVLDVGCGDGLYTLHMSALAREIVGVDFSEAMIAAARRHQQSSGIRNVRFRVWEPGVGWPPVEPGGFDLIYSRRGPSSHLSVVRPLLRPGGLVAGIHTGARERILGRLAEAGYRVLRNEEFTGREIMPTVEDYALYLSRIPGLPDFTLPEHQAELAERAAAARTPEGYAVDRWWFIWVATPA